MGVFTALYASFYRLVQYPVLSIKTLPHLTAKEGKTKNMKIAYR